MVKALHQEMATLYRVSGDADFQPDTRVYNELVASVAKGEDGPTAAEALLYEMMQLFTEYIFNWVTWILNIYIYSTESVESESNHHIVCTVSMHPTPHLAHGITIIGPWTHVRMGSMHRFMSYTEDYIYPYIHILIRNNFVETGPSLSIITIFRLSRVSWVFKNRKDIGNANGIQSSDILFEGYQETKCPHVT